MLSLRWVMAAAILALGAPLIAQTTYDEFMARDPATRRERFAQLAPEDKSIVKRTHAERWLSANRSRLSAAQQAVAEEAIAFLTPQLYASPNDLATLERDKVLRRQLSCVLGRENARQAFMLDPPAARSGRAGDQSAIDQWLAWFYECVLP